MQKLQNLRTFSKWLIYIGNNASSILFRGVELSTISIVECIELSQGWLYHTQPSIPFLIRTSGKSHWICLGWLVLNHQGSTGRCDEKLKLFLFLGIFLPTKWRPIFESVNFFVSFPIRLNICLGCTTNKTLVEYIFILGDNLGAILNWLCTYNHIYESEGLQCTNMFI